MADLQPEGVAKHLYNGYLSDGNGAYTGATGNQDTSREFSIQRRRHNPYHQNENCAPSWITNGSHSATSHGMFQQRQPAPHLVKPKPHTGFQSDSNHQTSARPLQLQASRRSRHFVPLCRKDEYYWMKRRKNNEAARKSREKRRNNDMILAQNVLVLLQENIKLKKDLFAVKMKYNEIEPEEFNEFRRKLDDGELLSGLTHNLNLADYGIPEHVLKALNTGREINLANCMSMPNEKLPNDHISLADIGKDEASRSSSSDDYSQIVSITDTQPAMNSIQGNKQTDWSRCNGNNTRMDTDEQLLVRDRDVQEVTPQHSKTWTSEPSPCISDRSNVVQSTFNDVDYQQTRFYSHDLVKGAEMLQSFIQYSWQQAASNANGKADEKMGSHVVPASLSPNVMISSQWLKQSDCTSSSSSDDGAFRQKTMERGFYSNQSDVKTSPSMSRASSSSPQSDDSSALWRNCQGFGSSSSSGQEDWSSKSGDYSSSDSCSGSSHVASPRASNKREECSDPCDSDDKSCRLPYKLRFKLAALHGGQEEQIVQR